MNLDSADDAKKAIEFLKYAEQLKAEYRNAFKSDGQKESSADHSWSLALLVIMIAPKLLKRVNIEKMLKIAIVHDLVEIDAKDVPVLKHINNKEATDVKFQNELTAMQGIHKRLGDFGKEVFDLWEEYANRASTEALIVRALDKLEGQLQFLNDKKTNFTDEDQSAIAELLKQTSELCEIDPFLKELDEKTMEERRERIKW